MTERFDDLARAMAEPEAVGRRGLLRRALAVLGVGAGVAILGEGQADAATAQCPPGLWSCNGRCRDVSSHPNHCGACGHVCPNDSVCRGGTCVKVACDCGPACESGKTLCGSLCVNLQTDTDNCGACGTQCASGEECQAGVCASACIPQTCAQAGAQCGSINDLCGGTRDCGPCGSGEICISNICSAN